MDQESLNLHKYVIHNFDISSLNVVVIHIHSSEEFASVSKSSKNIQVEELEINSGIFSYKTGSDNAYHISIDYHNLSLFLSCSCNTKTLKLCRHQAETLLLIEKNSELRAFYDPIIRNQILKKTAESFGLQNEPNLEQHFNLIFFNGALSIKPKQQGLIPFTKELLDFSSKFVKGKNLRNKILVKSDQEDQKLVIFKQHKYYKHLNIKLAKAQFSEQGKIKSPVEILKAIDFVWQSESPAETKFFTALQLFESYKSEETDPAAIEALKAIAKNPLKLPFFEHSQESSDQVVPKALKPIRLQSLIEDIKISVFREDNFYKISGQVKLVDVSAPISELQLKLDYLIEKEENFYLFNNVRLFKLFTFFKQNGNEILIHESKFEEFRNSFLSKVEEDATVNYSYLKKASTEQLIDNNFHHPPQRLIYLSDSDPYIDIEPVMKYGSEEVAILSKKQIYFKGIHGEAFTVQRDTEAEIQFTALVARQHAFFKEQLEDGLHYFYLHKERFLKEEWFLNVFEEWKEQEIQVLGFNELRNNKLNPNKAKVSIQVLSGLNWFNIDLDVKFGKKRASLKQLKKAVKNKNKYVDLDDGTQGILPQEWVEKFRQYFEAAEIGDDIFKIPKTNFALINQLFEDEVLSSDVRAELDYFHSSFSDFESIGEVEIPVGFVGELRDYQKMGLNWLNFLDKYNFGACLADDMGLGKTVQVIAFLLLQKKKRSQSTNLLVVPTSLIFNWQEEVSKFAPSLTVYTLHGTGRTSTIADLDNFDIVLTTYGTLLSDVRFLKNVEFNYVILDESQNIKNPESQRYKAVRLLKSRNRIALTGTPFENNSFDLYAQFSFACPGLLGSKQYFRDVYSTPIDKFKDSKRTLELQNLIKPFILRRTKKQVAPELPDKTEMILYCDMQEAQRKIYENYEQEMRDYLSGIPNDDISKNTIHVLRGLTRLRQICDSPLLLDKPTFNEINSSKIDTLLEQIESKSKHHKILVFSQFVTMLELVKKELNHKKIPFVILTGSTKDRQKVVKEFQDNEEIKVFLISLKAGGTGLNLTKADYVYLLDPWWNPAVENQAIDRVYRIGQKKNVIAVRMICPDTVEEKILKLQETKNESGNNLISSESSFFKSLTKSDLLSLLSPTVPLSIR